MHTRTVIAIHWLRHEGQCLAIAVRYVVQYIFQVLHFIRFLHECVERHTDFALTGRSHFMVVNFNCLAHVFEHEAHGLTQVMQ